MILSCVIFSWDNLYNLFFFFNDTATTEIYTLSLHDALPISPAAKTRQVSFVLFAFFAVNSSVPAPMFAPSVARGDRKSTRLNSSHLVISYAVFCLKKKKNSIVQHIYNSYTSSYIQFTPIIIA